MAVGEEALGEGEGSVVVSVSFYVIDAKVDVVVFYSGRAEGRFSAFYLSVLRVGGWEGI